MSELIPLQCPNCAGHVDPITMQCKSCGLQFKMKSDGTLMRIDMYAHKCIPIGASVYVPSFYVIDHPKEAMEMSLHKMAEKMVEHIMPLIEFQTSYDMRHDDYVVYGRIRVEEPQFNNRKFDETNQLIDRFFGGLR